MKRLQFLQSIAALGLLSFITKNTKPQRILVTGGHPDDPETGCGGAIAHWIAQGHEVTIVYFTTGQAGIEGLSHQKAASIRTEEAKKACAILGAKPIFMNQIDGASFVNNEVYKTAFDLLKLHKPDLLLTHWPIDTHRDHRHCANAFVDAWNNWKNRGALYFYEVMTGAQSQNFQPTDYVDITKVVEQKHKACFIHKSQKIKENYPNDHAKMEVFRGLEKGVAYAEAFVKYAKSEKSDLF